MRNAGLAELQARIKMGGNTDNLRYVDDTPLLAKSEEELKNLLMKDKICLLSVKFLSQKRPSFCQKSPCVRRVSLRNLLLSVQNINT